MSANEIFKTKITDKQGYETMLVFCGICVLMSMRSSEPRFWLVTSLICIAVGLFVKPLALVIARLWFAIPTVLGPIMTWIVLGIVFYLVLWPIAKLSQIGNKNGLSLQRDDQRTTMWVTRDHKYQAADLENIW